MIGNSRPQIATSVSGRPSSDRASARMAPLRVEPPSNR